MAKKSADWRCGGARGLPINLTRAWDGDAERKRMLRAAGVGGAHPDVARAKRGFLLYDAANPEIEASYKLPFCDIIGGRLTAIADGVSAAKAFLNRTDAPKRELERAGAIIADYERRIAEMKKRDRDARRASAPAETFAYGAGTPVTHIAHRMLNAPLALHPCGASRVTALLSPAGAARAEVDGADGAPVKDARPYALLNGMALIPVTGMLVAEAGFFGAFFGLRGYDGIRAAYAEALADPAVRGIVLDVDSPGGEVGGCFDLAREIQSVRDVKPSCTVIGASGAYSAAYALAAATGRIYVSASAGVGSVGILALVADLSKALETAGIAVNVIQFGARKADGLELLPLSIEARERFQADINALGEMFVDLVASARGLPASAVRATQAGTFLGADAVRAKFADVVASKSQALAAFSQSLS